MTKEQAEAFDKNPNIGVMFANSDSDSDSEYVDIDEFEYDTDNHAIFPSKLIQTISLWSLKNSDTLIQNEFTTRWLYFQP